LTSSVTVHEAEMSICRFMQRITSEPAPNALEMWEN